MIPEPNVEEVIDAVNRLEELASVRRLMDLLQAAPRRDRAPVMAARG